MIDAMGTTSLDAYATFLTARWDEEEAAAREAIAERDRIKFVDPSNNGPDWCFDANPDAPVPVVSVGPERVIADLAAKRELLENLVGWERLGFLAPEANSIIDESAELLAAPFRDHPDHPANQEAQ